MLRYNSSDILEVGRLTSGTSAQFIGYNTKTGKKGIYKQNGCVLGVDNDDVREKLSSDILSSLGVDVASIDLVRDEENGENAYFSNYIIEDNEELIAPNTMGCEGQSTDPIENLCERYVQGVSKLTNDEQLIEDIRKNFNKYTYLCCMLDCYDIKPDNLPLVYNKDNNEFSIAPYFDFGTAFCPEHKSANIYNMSTDEILESVFKNNYEDIKDIVHQFNTEFTPEKISEIFNQDFVNETLGEDEIEKIKDRFASQVQKSREMEIAKEQVVIHQTKGIGKFFSNIKNKMISLFGRKKDTKLLAENYEDREKLASLGYSSVAEMNADDPEAEMFARLQENTWPPKSADVVTYDNNYEEPKNEGQNITLEQ